METKNYGKGDSDDKNYSFNSSSRSFRLAQADADYVRGYTRRDGTYVARIKERVLTVALTITTISRETTIRTVAGPHPEIRNLPGPV